VKPLASLGPDEARGLRGILFDLDDTVLTHGLLSRAAYGAIWDLQDAGLAAVAVTGRPCGWGEVLARQWPVAGCVTENCALHLEREGVVVVRHDACDAAERASRRARLAALVERVRAAVPEAELTEDADLRVSDVTWDVAERARLPPDAVRRVVAEIEGAGARWSLSSVHLHATFDTDDKASGAVRFCVRVLGEDAGAVLARYAFVGDSGNDAPCFGAFRTTFGVANVRASLARIGVCPAYVAGRPMGDGFAEVVAAVLRHR
jgi:HAD superfamily hydrolase (TIGR01484 family)